MLIAICFLILQLLPVTTAVNSVGSACSVDEDCIGANEICQQMAWLEPSCSTGMCVCITNYTTGDRTGYTPWSYTNDCALLTTLQLGDSCTSSYEEIILTSNAICNTDTGVVECNSDSINYGSFCLKNYGFSFGEGVGCLSSAQCAGEMGCYDSVCRCRFYMKYDATTGKCSKREFGDSCTTDDQCNANAKNWEGYTSFSGACLNNKCDCAPNAKKVTVSYFNAFSGVLTDKTICVTNLAKTGLINQNMTYGKCYLDPAYWSESSTYGFCAQGYVCAACPDDIPTWTSGYCRKAVSSTKPVMLSFNTASGSLPTVTGETAPPDALKTPNKKATRAKGATIVLGHTAATTTTMAASPSNGLKSWEIGVIVGVIGGFVCAFSITLALCCYKRKNGSLLQLFGRLSDQKKKLVAEEEKKARPELEAGPRPTLEMRTSAAENQNNFWAQNNIGSVCLPNNKPYPLPMYQGDNGPQQQQTVRGVNRNYVAAYQSVYGQYPPSYALTSYATGDPNIR